KDLMPAPAQVAEYSPGLGLVFRFSEDFVVNHDYRVSAKNDSRRKIGSCRTGLLTSEPFHIRLRAFASISGFVYLNGKSLERPTHSAQNLSAPRAGGSQDDPGQI